MIIKKVTVPFHFLFLINSSLSFSLHYMNEETTYKWENSDLSLFLFI
jgi:hypothetical protein